MVTVLETDPCAALGMLVLVWEIERHSVLLLLLS